MTRRFSITSTGTGHTPEAALRSLLAAVAKSKAKDITTTPKRVDKVRGDADHYRALQAAGVEARRRKVHTATATACEDCGTPLEIGDGVGEFCPTCDGVVK